MFRTDLFSETSAGALMASAYIGAPLIVDSFAGGGGASTGIEMALGRSPDIAINHNPEALALHAANHPETHHLSENVYRVDPLDHLKGKHIGLAWFSPDCKHFSKAKGGKPVERNIRDLCWIIPGWIERIQKSGGRVDIVIMENVEEFKDYGPLIETERGLMPDPERKGELFEKWCKKLRRLGGRIEYRELIAYEFGAPTIRKRLFVIIRFDGKPIVWPEPTHGKPSDPDVISGKKLPWRTAAECIDWSLPCPSIFDTSEQIWAKHSLRAVRPLADATMARVARGMKRYVLDAERPFLVQTGYGERIGQAPRAMSVDDPLGTAVAGGIKHAFVAPSVIRFNTGATGQDAREPLSTVTANSFIKRPGGAAPLVIIAPVLTAAQQGGSVRPVDAPHHTITASNKDQNSVIVPTLIGCGGRAGQSRPCGGGEPNGTITAKADGCVAVAFMAQHNNDSRRIGGVNPGRPVDEPISTVTATGAQQGLVTPYLSHLYTSNTAGGQGNPERPLKTVTAGGGHAALVSPFLQAYYGTGDGQHETEPMRTVTTKDRHGHVEATVSAPPFTEAQADRAREVAAFMRSHGFWDGREFVTVEISGETFVIVDIGMRMLTPRELYNAQGFPPDYVINGAWDYQADGAGPVWRDFSKSVQVSCVGNSVSPPVARALVAANCGHLAAQLEAA
jgi:DNA (cytosine-5)-methyltransferase 1